jgi:hypothetical protein
MWRRLTVNEAALIKAPASWYVMVTDAGAVVLGQPVQRVVSPVNLPEKHQAAIQGTLEAFWGRDERARGIYLAPEILRRVSAASREAIARGHLPADVRRELEWVVEAMAKS